MKYMILLIISVSLFIRVVSKLSNGAIQSSDLAPDALDILAPCCNQGPGLGSGDARESVSHHHQAPQHRRQGSSAVVVMKLLVSENKQVFKT